MASGTGVEQWGREVLRVVGAVWGIDRKVCGIRGFGFSKHLLVEEDGVPEENHRPTANHWQTLSHNVV
jgi:hypothetical protein